MALARLNRLRLRQDFSTVYRKGIRRRSAHLTLLAVPQKAMPKIKQPAPRSESGAVSGPSLPTRVGISISQKVSKRAVVRNRIKRQLRAALRSLLPQFAVGWDLVVVVQPEATQCDYRQFLQELKQLLIDAEVFNGY